MRTTWILTLAATGALLATPTRAEPLAAVEPARNVLPLSLGEAISMGLENNLELEVLRHDPLIQEENYQISWGAYDPVLAGSAGYEEFNPTQANLLFASAETQTTADGDAGLSGMVPFLGATYAIDFLGERSEADIFINAFQQQYTSDLTFSASLPLLRGLVWNQAWTQVKQSDVERDMSNEDLRGQIMRIIQIIETLYWDLVAFREARAVAAKSLETASALLEQERTRYEVGVVSKVSVVEAEAGVARREADLIVAETRYLNSQDNLINAVLGAQLTGTTSLEIDPTESPDAYSVFDVDVPSAVNVALEKRPELRSAALGIEQSELELRFRRNQRLPGLDVRGSYGVQGLSGRDTDPPDVAETGPNFRDAPGSFFGENDGDRWDVRAVLSIPITNIAGRHGVSRAELELRRAEVQLQRTRRDIILEVRQSARELMAGLEEIEARERERLAAEEQLRAENVRLEHGESTPFDVLQREEALADAKLNKIRALNQYRLAETALLQAQGIILEARNVLYEDAATLR